MRAIQERVRSGAAGTNIAMHCCMAAVLCLVLLPLMAAAGFMLGVVNGQFSAASLLGGITFVLLGFGMFFGVFKMSRDWENEEQH